MLIIALAQLVSITLQFISMSHNFSIVSRSYTQSVAGDGNPISSPSPCYVVSVLAKVCCLIAEVSLVALYPLVCIALAEMLVVVAQFTDEVICV